MTNTHKRRLGDVPAPRATEDERARLHDNLLISMALYGDLDLDSLCCAHSTAAADRDKAARCYAAIVRSL